MRIGEFMVRVMIGSIGQLSIHTVVPISELFL